MAEVMAAEAALPTEAGIMIEAAMAETAVHQHVEGAVLAMTEAGGAAPARMTGIGGAPPLLLADAAALLLSAAAAHLLTGAALTGGGTGPIVQ